MKPDLIVPPQTKEPTFSAIIPTFNRARFLPLAIESVLNQKFADHEIIVVDDGSEDNTQQTVAPYREKIRFIHQKNQGVSAARNSGIRAARGRWVAFLDSDDEWLPDYFAVVKDLIDRHSNVAGVVLNSFAVAADGGKTNTFEARKLSPMFKLKTELWIEKPFRHVITHRVTALQSCVFRRENLLTTRLFDESLTIAEDLDVVAQMALQGPFVFCNKIYSHIIRRQESLAGLSTQLTRSGIRTRRAWAKVYERFLNEGSLDQVESTALRKKFASAQRALGNLLLRSGSTREAREAYRKSWSLDHSLASFGRLLFACLPARTGRLLLPNEDDVEAGQTA